MVVYGVGLFAHGFVYGFGLLAHAFIVWLVFQRMVYGLGLFFIVNGPMTAQSKNVHLDKQT